MQLRYFNGKMPDQAQSVNMIDKQVHVIKNSMAMSVQISLMTGQIEFWLDIYPAI